MPSNDAWYAVQVRPHSENKVASHLELKGYTQFVPNQMESSHGAGRGARSRPLFPGYVFCRFDSTLPGKIVTTPGVICIVGYGNVWIPIPELEIEGIRRIVNSGMPVKSHPYGYERGECVQISEGPFRGIVATVSRACNKNFLIVPVSLIQQAIAIEIDGDSILPLNLNSIDNSCSYRAGSPRVVEREAREPVTGREKTCNNFCN